MENEYIKVLEEFRKGLSHYGTFENEVQAIENLIKRNKELKNALINMVNQFADTDKEEKYLYTMGLSALENAFSTLDIDEGIKRENLWKLQEGDDK